MTAHPLLGRCCFLLRCRLTTQCLPLLLVIGARSALLAQAMQPQRTVQFGIRDGYLIVVQTTVNGVGPFDFLLDTGATKTVIDPDLAGQLHVPEVGKVALTGVLRRRQDKLVRLHDVRLGEVSVAGLGAVVDKLERQKTLAPTIRGVLGEDFLSRFDFLIDYDRRMVVFGGPVPNGEHCRFEAVGQYRGSPTTNRLLIGVEFTEVSKEKVQLQLDTGARIPELFPTTPDSLPYDPSGGLVATSSVANETIIHSHVTLRIGSSVVHGLNVVQSRRAVAFDAAGLLPAIIFRRIYISHSGGFVILNPSE